MTENEQAQAFIAERKKVIQDQNNLDTLPEVQTLHEIPEPPEERAYSIGIPGMEVDLKFPSKGLATMIGPPSGGKSTVLRRILFNMAKDHGLRVALTCLEEPVKHRTQNVFRKMYNQKFIDQTDVMDLIDADNFINDKFLFVQKENHKPFTGWRLLEIMQTLFGMHDSPEIFAIDPFNEVDHTWDRREFNSKTDYVGYLLMEMKGLAEYYNKLIIIAAHPPVDQIRRKRWGNIPEFYEVSDAADSAHFYNKSDIGLGIWFDGILKETVINIDKVKNRELCGTIHHPYPFPVTLKFDYANESYRVNRKGWDDLKEAQDHARQ